MPRPLPRTYTAVRGVVRWMLRLFFREIAVEGREHIPTDRGGLLVAWHPNGVIDAGLMLAAFPGHVVFGARDGLLRWPILGNMMRAAGTVPIYRAQDQKGMTEAARREANQQSLDALAGAVAGGSYSALFPEGQSHDAPHVTPVKSGAARLFLRASALAGEARGKGHEARGKQPTARPRLWRQRLCPLPPSPFPQSPPSFSPSGCTTTTRPCFAPTCSWSSTRRWRSRQRPRPTRTR